MTERTFAELEHAGWDARAQAYDKGFNTISRMAFPSILNHLGADLTGRRVLDICSGTGELTAALAALGADVTGVDFSDAMVAVATGKFPQLSFDTGDAQNLEFDAESVDDIICAFGLLHMPDPDLAIAEAARVLRHGGRYMFTVWNAPEQGSNLMDIVFSAVSMHGSMDVGLPPAPDIFRFTDPAEVKNTLESAGFHNVLVETVDLHWHPPSGQEFLQMIYRSTVRMSMMLEGQSLKAKELIDAEIIARAEELRDGSSLNVAMPATLVTATKHE